MGVSFLLHLVKVSGCLGLFYLVYPLFLRNETYHHLKRAYLLSTLALSLLIPLLSIPISVPQEGGSTWQSIERFHHRIYPPSIRMGTHLTGDPTVTIPLSTKTAQPQMQTNGRTLDRSVSLGSVLLILYLGGVGVLTLRFAVQLILLFQRIQRHPRSRVGGHQVVEVTEPRTACTFFQTILLNRSQLDSSECEQVLRHETVHARQHHTFDIMLVQGMAIGLWFNPVVWWYRSALRVVHECLADAAVLRSGVDPQSYHTLVLRQLLGLRSQQLICAMSAHALKQRVRMMTKPSSSAQARLKVLWSLPLLGLLLAFFALRIIPAPHVVTAAGIQTTETKTIGNTDPYAPVIIRDAERIYKHILKTEMATKDYIWRSYIYARLACMRTAGWDIDYETLMPVSGYGLTFAYAPKEGCGMHFFPPPGTDRRISQATGFGWEYVHYKDIEAYWQALKETIDSGRPIQAPHHEEVLFVGYQEAEKKKHRRVRPMAISVFVDTDTWWSWREFQKWFAEFGGSLGRFTGKTERLSDRQVAIETMQSLVNMAFRDPRDKGTDKHVAWGVAGIEAFARDMADLSMKERHFCSGWFSCHDSNPQWTARQLTGRYLQVAAGLFAEDAATLIRDAVRDYQAAHQAWLQWEQQLGAHSPHRAWSMERHRLAGASAVRQAAQHERDAVAKIEQALELL